MRFSLRTFLTVSALVPALIAVVWEIIRDLAEIGAYVLNHQP